MFRFIQSPFIGAPKTKKYYQTFTYFVPSPPKRKSGYQEKELDKIVKKIISRGFEIENSQLVSNGNVEVGGFWIHFTLSHFDKKSIDENTDFLESNIETIDGIEIINDE